MGLIAKMSIHRVRFIVLKTYFRFPHIAEDYLFSMFLSILTFDFDITVCRFTHLIEL